MRHLFELLDARGFKVLLVNAHHVKNVSDAGFMRQLSDNSISHGLPRATQNGLLKVLKQHTS